MASQIPSSVRNIVVYLSDLTRGESVPINGSVSKLYTLSFILICQDIQFRFCCFFTSLLSVSESLCLSQVLTCLPSKTLYPFVENPRGFCRKPYTLLPRRSAPDSGRQGVSRLSVGRIRGRYACSSSRLSLYSYQVLCGRCIVGCGVFKKGSTPW